MQQRSALSLQKPNVWVFQGFIDRLWNVVLFILISLILSDFRPLGHVCESSSSYGRTDGKVNASNDCLTSRPLANSPLQESWVPLQDESSVELKVFPKQRPAFVQLLQRLRGSGPDASFLVGRTYEPHTLHLLSVAFGATAWPPGLLLDEAALEAFRVRLFAALQSGSARPLAADRNPNFRIHSSGFWRAWVWHGGATDDGARDCFAADPVILMAKKYAGKGLL